MNRTRITLRKPIVLLFACLLVFGLVKTAVFSIPTLAASCSAQMYERGTNNDWGTTPMTLVNSDTCTWQVTVTFPNESNQRFKFDRYGDWSSNYGDNNSDGYVDYFGRDIAVSPGIYSITFVESTGAYTVGSANPTMTPSPTATSAPTCSPQMYERGTNNDWGNTPMTLVDSGTCSWQVTVTFPDESNQRFKFDLYGDWSSNYGDNNSDGYVDYFGSDIAVSPGTYRITYVESTGAYTIVSEQPPTPTSSPTPVPTNTSTPSPTPSPTPTGGDGIIIHYKEWNNPNIYAWLDENGTVTELRGGWPGTAMAAEENDWYGDSFPSHDSINLIFNNGSEQTGNLSRTTGEWWYKDGNWTDYNPEDTTPPSIVLTGPSSGTKSGVVPVTVNANDNVGIDRVEFLYRGQVVGQSSMAPYTFNWNTAYTCDGTGELFAVAYDLSGNSAQSTAVTITTSNPNLPPIANAGADMNAVVGITAFFDGSASADQDCDIVSYDWSNGLNGVNPGKIYNTPGTYTVTLTVTDDEGATDSDDVVVTVREQAERDDFRKETIYFLMTTRFYDGDSSNNVYAWDDESAGNVANNDPAWRGDFKGLVEKLDYIKALGFSAIWITPVVENMSGYDYHGYHAVDFNEVDPRYESPGYDYQRLIEEAHARGIKVIQDVVFNHTGNFGEENLYPLFTKDPDTPDTAENLVNIAPEGMLPANYDLLTPDDQYQARITATKEDYTDTEHIYHHEKSLSWESYTVQTGQIAGDAVDLNTENPAVYEYIIDAYNQYIDMGVDGFRIDTVKHISRLTFNKAFNPAFMERGGENFFMFGEVAARYRQVWNSGIPAISVPFYTWAESQSYPWSSTDRTVNEDLVFQHWNDNQNVADQPTSNNHALYGNSYHTPDWSMSSHMAMIDFPMHWNFANAWDAFSLAVGTDHYYNDATWNVVYVDSHDYAPDTAPENQRFAGSQSTWAENLNLMFTFRGIPTIYYGSEIEFQKGMVIDVGPNKPLAETGRAYFGDHLEGSITVSDFGQYSNATGEIANTLNHPLAQHIRRLNLIRRAVPALQMGQYATSDISASGMAFKRAYTADGIDSFVLVTISGGATFYNLPGGTYRDAITGDTITVAEGGSLTANVSGQGNMRVYVLNGPGKIGEDGTYLK